MILKLNHFVLHFLFFDFALKIMLLFGEIWHRGQIKKKSEFRDVREKSFSTFRFHFFLRNYAFPGSNLSVACACTDSPRELM